MRRITRLTERDLRRIAKKVILEEDDTSTNLTELNMILGETQKGIDTLNAGQEFDYDSYLKFLQNFLKEKK